nr:synaptogenesis protein syg-2-like [Lytechinus pictus]
MPPALLEWRIPDDVTVVHQDQSNVIQDGSYISQKAMTITPSRKDHGKILSCITSHPELQNERLCSVHLNVEVLPRDVLLFLTGGNQSHSTVLNVQEDSLTSITCKSIGSFPATELTFWLFGDGDGTQIPANLSTTRSVLDGTLFDTESTITIHPDKKNHGMHIVCYSSIEGDLVLAGVARLVVLGPPDDITITLPDDGMFEGAETNVTCRGLNGNPAPLIHWYLGSTNVTDNSSMQTIKNIADLYDAESILFFTPKRADHGKCLICVAVQPDIPSLRSVNDSTMLTISYHPIVSNTFRRLPTIEPSGSARFVLKCTADANPPVIYFEWLCNETLISNDTVSVTLPENSSERETMTSSELAVQFPRPEYPCIYRCTAKSRYGEGIAVFNTSIATTPDPPSLLDMQQKQTTSSAVFVAWQPGLIIELLFTCMYK